MAKIPIVASFVGYIPTFLSVQRVATNPFLDHWVKTLPVWLRCAHGLPVKICHKIKEQVH